MRHIPRSIERIPLVRGAFRLLLTAYVKIFKSRYIIENRLGLRLLLDHENIIDWQVYISGRWEGPQTVELFELVTYGNVPWSTSSRLPCAASKRMPFPWRIASCSNRVVSATCGRICSMHFR